MRVGGLPVPKESDSPYVLRHSQTASESVPSGSGVDAGPSSLGSRDTHSVMSPFALPNADAWDPSQSISSASETDTDFIRTLGDFSSGNAAPLPGAGAFDWSGDGVVVPEMGFQWEEWGGLFASAFGLEEFNNDGHSGGSGRAQI